MKWSHVNYKSGEDQENFTSQTDMLTTKPYHQLKGFNMIKS